MDKLITELLNTRIDDIEKINKLLEKINKEIRGDENV